MDNEEEAIPLPAYLADFRATLLTDFREVEQELKSQEKADERGFEKHLVWIELGTVFVAVVAIIVMQKLQLEGLCEVGTLIPTCLLALFRITRS